MNKLLILILLFYVTINGYSQGLYGIINLTAPFSGISYTKGHNKEEFRPSIARINVSWGADIIYKTKKIKHKISVEQVPFEKNFKIINKFIAPPNNENLLGFTQDIFGTSIDYFTFSYALQKEGKKEKGFLFHSRIRFNYSAGLGLSFNRSKKYYRDKYARTASGWQDPETYEAYEAIHYRDGLGIFIRGTGGFDFINKKGKRNLCFNIFYNQGIKDMAHFDIHYQYGYWNDPSKQVDVPSQLLYSRGTTFGFSFGVPIIIKK
jgi:hypothetical protein